MGNKNSGTATLTKRQVTSKQNRLEALRSLLSPKTEGSLIAQYDERINSVVDKATAEADAWYSSAVDKVNGEIKEIESELVAAGANIQSRRGAPRGRNAGSQNAITLDQAVLIAMSNLGGDGVSLKEIVAAVPSVYTTDAHNLNVQVNQALGRLKKRQRVSRPSRGVYRLSKHGSTEATEAQSSLSA